MGVVIITEGRPSFDDLRLMGNTSEKEAVDKLGGSRTFDLSQAYPNFLL